MKKIKLTKGKYALVDDSDFDYLNQWKWSFLSSGYAMRTDKNNKAVLMHRILIETKKGKEVDHINENKLDNRRENLRIVNRSENMANVTTRKHNSSGYKGVHIVPKSVNSKNRWVAQITKDYKNHFIGYFSNKENAALAYNKKAKELFGDFARVNTL